MTNRNMDLHFSLDRIVATDNRIFGWGWAAHASLGVTDVHLRVAAGGQERRLRADHGHARADVANAFGHLRDGASSGFIVTGFVPHGEDRRVWLEVDLDDGERREFDITDLVHKRDQTARRKRQLAYVLRALWRRLRRGDLSGILRRARAQSYAAPTLDDAGVLDEVVPALRGAKGAWLVFDHNMGGGANQYRRNFVRDRVAAGHAVAFCTYNLPMLEYRLHLYRPGEEDRVFRISTFLVLEALFEALDELHVFVNSPVSFEEPLMLAEWLARMRLAHPHTRLTVTTHDYFAACPSFVLLDSGGRHCGVPSLDACRRCLATHQASYVSLSPPTDIESWRASWGRCLAAADEVRCFSDASRLLLMKAYPALSPDHVTLVPHKVDFVPARTPRLPLDKPLVVGVVGEISAQKGALIVTRMVEIIERDGIDARIVVIGAFDAVCDSPRLTVTGAYRHDQLVDLIEKHAINMFLFPSIWPETFSYVVAELMSLRAPVVAFDLGAPGERLKSYPLGRLCADVSAESALATLRSFHAELAGNAVARVA
jgi:glycosyltransferase involved in cell wall biosynthesis